METKKEKIQDSSKLKPRGRNPHDEFDLCVINQYHNIVLTFSKNCFETKKTGITLILTYYTLVVGMFKLEIFPAEDSPLRFLVLFIPSIITFLFYLYDVYNFYYTLKFRDLMGEMEINYIFRNNIQNEISWFPTDFSIKIIDREKSLGVDEKNKPENEKDEKTGSIAISKTNLCKRFWSRLWKAIKDESTFVPYLVVMTITIIVMLVGR